MIRWSPVYVLARIIALSAIVGFFKKFERTGYEKVPRNRPIIFAPNHQSGFMDPVLVAGTTRGQTHFLVRADVFKSKLIIVIFKWLKMMPVYRQRDGVESLEKNQEIFNQCFYLLKNKRAIIMFPEGNQQNRKTLRTLKKGVGRIAFGAEEKYQFQLDALIIPVGINYGHYTKMYSTIHLKFGDPIPLSDFKEAYEENAPRAFNALRERMQNELAELVINIQDKENYDTIEEIRLIAPDVLHENAGLKRGALENDFQAGKKFIADFDSWKPENETKVQQLRDRTAAFKAFVEQNDLRYHLFEKETHSVIGSIFFLIVFLPVHIAGVIINYIPFKIPEKFVEKKVKDPHFHASIKALSGSILFFHFYLIIGVVVAIIFGWYWLPLTFIIAPLLGYFSLKYWVHFLKTRGRIRYNKMRKTPNANFEKALVHRQQIIQTIRELSSVG